MIKTIATCINTSLLRERAAHVLIKATLSTVIKQARASGMNTIQVHRTHFSVHSVAGATVCMFDVGIVTTV